ncbi:glutathione synthetase-like isoform X2 [Anneissia japonica]|uniref:glutathione synthetase-like isoform X2 n=1 Tax=Anneissia japonica TaxID=1529436 RepID=UPI0014256827|nr:glutathione synthetase-like isoform X2 [Anneissia japonica]
MTSSAVFENDRLDEVIQKAKDFALTHGLIKPLEAGAVSSAVTHISFLLAPLPIPRHLFEKMQRVQLDFNKLMYNVSQDYEFICNALKSSLNYDEFTRDLVEIYHKVHQKKIKDRGMLEILRCDYMLDSKNNEEQFKQIEINMIAAGMASTSAILTHLHRYTLRLSGNYEGANQVPDNLSLEGVATALVRAWEVYGQPNASILLVAEPTDVCCYNHRHIEFSVHEINPQISFMRTSLGDIGKRASLADDQQLIMDGIEIAVVYYRTGYKPAFYKSKVGPKGDHAVDIAINNREKFVLKPNREAGGNNLFGNEIFKKLTEFKDSPERTKYILMEKIVPVKVKGYLVKQLKPAVTLQELSYELGIFGAVVGNNNGIVHNRQIGHLLRTKPAEANEGSLLAETAVMDSPFLTS